MLRQLTIRDFVIVDALELEFERGFTVLTGETGAGKSILIDALSLVLGERADAGQVRAGAERAEVAAEFDLAALPGATAFLAQAELEGDEGVCLMRRTVDGAGRSRAYVNGRSVTLQQMRELGELLVDIHGQHAHQSLLKPAVQRDLLDGFAGARELAREVRDAWQAWRTARAALDGAERDAAAQQAEREELEASRRDLSALEWTPAGWAETLAEHGRLAHGAALLEGAEFALATLADQDESCLPRLGSVATRLEDLSAHDPALREMLELLEAARIPMQEAVYSLRHYARSLDPDPQRLREVEGRIDRAHSVARKYRVQVDALGDLLATTEARLAVLGDGLSQEDLARREAEAGSRYRAVAKKLGSIRAKAARDLSGRVTETMRRLAMPDGRLDIALVPLQEPGAAGLEVVEFQVAAHAGVAAGALAKVASGGELSRVSLAIQVATARLASVPTLIFDEVDVGIGGGVAEVVGQLLRRLGEERQVMSVTHLPQVAAQGDHHWTVAKRVEGGRPVSRIHRLDGVERVEELARMLGGMDITPTTRAHAAELLGTRARGARR